MSSPGKTSCIPTSEWRAEAIFRLFRDLVCVTKFSGTNLENCWMPKHAVDPTTGAVIDEFNDYVKVRMRGKNWGAHVAVAILVFNKFPTRDRGADENDVVLHLCNNPACRNPLHLKFGTSKEDSEYRVKCGRSARGSQLHGPKRSVAVMLLRKYAGKRGYRRAIADYLGTTLGAIDSLKRDGKHLLPGVEDTEIELNLKAWVSQGPAADKVASIARKAGTKRKVMEIRKLFHLAPIVERSTLLSRFIQDYGFTDTYVRKILKREVHQDIAPEIPVPKEWGIGRRKSYSRASAK